MDFLLKLGDGTHPLLEGAKQKEKTGSCTLLKVGDGAHQNQNQNFLNKEERK